MEMSLVSAGDLIAGGLGTELGMVNQVELTRGASNKGNHRSQGGDFQWEEGYSISLLLYNCRMWYP